MKWFEMDDELVVVVVEKSFMRFWHSVRKSQLLNENDNTMKFSAKNKNIGWKWEK